MTKSDVEAAVCVLLDNALAATEAAAAAGPIVVRSGSERGSVFLTVEDEGVGVDPANVGRIGEPFFTTKETGQGMGLGLFVVRNLLEQLGGRLEVERRSPRGTSVRLCFAAKELASG
jgi:two-component system sensor histidine kinase RegB